MIFVFFPCRFTNNKGKYSDYPYSPQIIIMQPDCILQRKDYITQPASKNLTPGSCKNDAINIKKTRRFFYKTTGLPLIYNLLFFCFHATVIRPFRVNYMIKIDIKHQG